MKAFRAWRYKCDFCGKNARQKASMARHELGCTANPNRVCGVHRHLTGDSQAGIMPVAPLVMLLRKNSQDEDHGLAKLREATYNCPCCILAALRQAGLTKGYLDEEGYSPPPIGEDQFDFKTELQAVWNAKNEADSQSDRYDYLGF